MSAWGNCPQGGCKFLCANFVLFREMHFIKRASLSDLPDFDSSPVGRLALFFDAQFIALIEFPPDCSLFFFSPAHVVWLFANPLVI